MRHLENAPPDTPKLEIVHRAASEVGSAVLTAVSTTVISFLPVFTMIGEEGKLFKPLAFTKTFALVSSIIIALTVIPPGALILFAGKTSSLKLRHIYYGMLGLIGLAIFIHGINLSSFIIGFGGVILLLFAAYGFTQNQIPKWLKIKAPLVTNMLIVAFIGVLLSMYWEPLGPEAGLLKNFLFVALIVGALLGFFKLFQFVYPVILGWMLAHKPVLFSIVVVILDGCWLTSLFFFQLLL